MNARVGRPRIFETPEQMQEAINEYFADRENRGLSFTIESLAVALGMSRNTLMTYEKEPTHAEFNDTIKIAKDIVLSDLVDKSMSRDWSTAGCLFNLKNNYNYTDKVEQEITTKSFDFNIELETE